jgi:hypothetical protein
MIPKKRGTTDLHVRFHDSLQTKHLPKGNDQKREASRIYAQRVKTNASESIWWMDEIAETQWTTCQKGAQAREAH